MRISKIPKLFIIDHGIIEKIKFYHGVSCRLPAGRFDPLPVRNSDVKQTIFLQSNWSVLNGFWLPGNIIKDRNIRRHSLETWGCVIYHCLVGVSALWWWPKFVIWINGDIFPLKPAAWGGSQPDRPGSCLQALLPNSPDNRTSCKPATQTINPGSSCRARHGENSSQWVKMGAGWKHG